MTLSRQSRCLHWLPKALLALLLLVLTSVAWAIPKQSSGIAIAQSPQRLRDYIPQVKGRQAGSLNHLYQFDNDPLGDRLPVILVPGRIEEFQRNGWWMKVYHQAHNHDWFRKRHKLYVFVYDSTERIPVHASHFRHELLAYFGDFAQRPDKLVLVTYSLGGSITRQAMTTPELYPLVGTVFGIAVSYHGSPIFNTRWFEDHYTPLNGSPVRGWWDRTIFKAYMYKKDNLTEGLSWDGFDTSWPIDPDTVRQGKAADPKRAKALPSILGPDGNPAYKDLPLTDVFKQRLIVYAGYLTNPHTTDVTTATGPFRQQAKSNSLARKATDLPKLPVQWLGMILPVYGDSVHSLLRYVGVQLSQLPMTRLSDSILPISPINKLFRYNDTVFPLSSCLYLPPRKTPYTEPLKDLLSLRDVRVTRVFENLDHMQLGEYHETVAAIWQPLRRADVLHPEAGQHSPIAWLLHDIQRLEHGKIPGDFPG